MHCPALRTTLSVCAVQPCTYFQHTNTVNWLHSTYALLCAVNFRMMTKEQQKELEELAELLMQSENLAASVEILKQFGEKCWQEGACEAQNDAAKYIGENMVHYQDIPSHLFKGSF